MSKRSKLKDLRIARSANHARLVFSDFLASPSCPISPYVETAVGAWLGPSASAFPRLPFGLLYLQFRLRFCRLLRKGWVDCGARLP
jgi:hypothetical protein